MAEEGTSAEAVEVPEVEQQPKKKKGKLPLILAVVLLILGAGGFFKLKGGPAAPPPLKLGATEKLEEFLVNLRGGQSYMRTEIGLQFTESFKKEELDKNLGAVRDSINIVLSSKKLSGVNSPEGKRALKREIASAVNEALNIIKGDSKEAVKGSAAGKGKLAHPDWDSDTGPVLKVYFYTIATQ